MIADKLDQKLVRTLRRKLLAWYRKNQRTLPWRAAGTDAPNPYHVLVSEAMLQQTQVSTVIDYFNRFINAFPTIQSLAKADEQEVLKNWQGLGYYRRARNLHKAAQLIVDEMGGVIPQSPIELEKLPGVGRYTAGAIASIAFAQRAAILDGNVARVLARWFAIEASIDDAATKHELWTLAERLVPKTKPGDFNQAMMELGALVCLPKNPACLTCSMADWCEANEHAMAHQLPVRTPKNKQTVLHHHAIAMERRGHFLFQQRPSDGLWSNMWELPTFEHLGPKPNHTAIAQAIESRCGLRAGGLTRLSSMRHATTHRKISFNLWSAEQIEGRLIRRTGQWRSLGNLKDLPLAKPQVWAVSILNRSL